MEFILIKYRSILDYSVDLIKEIFPKTEGYKLQGKFEIFNEAMKGNSDFDRYILSSNWFQDIKLIRDSVVHHGATCYIYNVEVLGFQVYDMDSNNMLNDLDEYMCVNANIVRVDRYLLINIAYLYHFLNICFKAITNELYRESDNKDRMKKSLGATE